MKAGVDAVMITGDMSFAYRERCCSQRASDDEQVSEDCMREVVRQREGA